MMLRSNNLKLGVALLFWANFVFAQIQFKSSTFDQFAYPNGILDEEYVEILEKRTNYSFPQTTNIKVASYITKDNPRTVVDYYAMTSGQRFVKDGDKFIYVFSTLNQAPANRIEIQPVPHLRIPKHLWPTRINLYVISYDIEMYLPAGKNRNLDDLRKLAGVLTYEGNMREDVAIVEKEELGADATCFIIETKDSYEQVYQFFRRRYGRLNVRPARDGDVWVRNFEFDGTGRAGLDRNEKVLYVRVDENPIVTDVKGNSQTYLGSVFIKYVFWKALKN